MSEMVVLFVCVENVGRSQMAEAFAKKYGIAAQSAGTQPSEKVNKVVIEAMKEKGIDLSSATPCMLTPEMIKKADLVITMGCSIEEACPRPLIAQMEKKLIDWHMEDPKDKSIDQVRRIRDEIEDKVLLLKKNLKQ